MTAPVIPPAAIEAAAKAYFGQIHEVNRARILAEFEAVLAAALPHLRPLFEVGTDDAAARWALLYSDAVDNGDELARELRQELRLATEVALKLGRQEMREEIAKAFEERWINTGHLVAAVTAARIARETGARS